MAGRGRRNVLIDPPSSGGKGSGEAKVCGCKAGESGDME